MQHINDNLKQIRNQIAQLCLNHELPKLIAVSKNFSAKEIIHAYHAQQLDFAENYIVEFHEKALDLKAYPLIWHFIGNIQSNKIKLLANSAQWVHSVDDYKHALKLSQLRNNNLPPLNILIQVNISNEINKRGLNSFDKIIKLAQAVNKLTNLKLRGLMGVASHISDTQMIRNQFNYLHTIFAQLNQHQFALDTISMGMSNDYPIAIECGATMLRIGSKIFGERPYAK